jgi:hypothetical protein
MVEREQMDGEDVGIRIVYFAHVLEEKLGEHCLCTNGLGWEM